MRLDRFSNPEFQRGRPAWMEALWVVASGIAFSTWIPGSAWRCALLRLFGASIGKGVIIKPRVRVKFPWKLTVGDYSWIGESVWIDNLDQVTIGQHCCISQGAYFCTGSHRWDRETFDLVTKPIVLGDRCWIAAHVRVALGSIVNDGAVLTMGMLASGEYEAKKIYHAETIFVEKDRCDKPQGDNL